YIAAPWRSLIYRNTDSPFTYSDDYALFSHMPRNTPGFDCRLPRIVGDWMVSIPARLKLQPGSLESQDATPAIYEEAKPSDSDYADAVAAAKKRLDLYHHGG